MMLNKIKVKIKYGYLWRFRSRLRKRRLSLQRRVLWRFVHDKAEYKPYKDLRGGGHAWHGRYLWKGRVVAYVDRRGNKWF